MVRRPFQPRRYYRAHWRGFTVGRGKNDLRQGIAAVSARIEDGILKILPGRCPNLLHEAELYRYSTEPEARKTETPEDDNNHSLAALRYLISRLDAGRLSRGNTRLTPEQQKEEKEKRLNAAQKKWLSYKNEALWTRIF